MDKLNQRVEVVIKHVTGYGEEIDGTGEFFTSLQGPITVLNFMRPHESTRTYRIACSQQGCVADAVLEVISLRTARKEESIITAAVIACAAIAVVLLYATVMAWPTSPYVSVACLILTLLFAAVGYVLFEVVVHYTGMSVSECSDDHAVTIEQS